MEMLALDVWTDARAILCRVPFCFLRLLRFPCSCCVDMSPCLRRSLAHGNNLPLLCIAHAGTAYALAIAGDSDRWVPLQHVQH
jgi:hypothetical protein